MFVMCGCCAKRSFAQHPPPAVGRGEASPPHKVFLVRFGGFAAKTNQK
jgi:hypothetical protein